MGALDEPVILVIEEEQLEGIFVISYCSKGAYFLNVPTENAYAELLPTLQKQGSLLLRWKHLPSLPVF